MTRLIDADAIIDFIDMGHTRNPLETCFSERDVVDMLESAPTVDAVPVRHGRWVRVETDTEQFFLCNRCRKREHWESNYCPRCGAKMYEEVSE